MKLFLVHCGYYDPQVGDGVYEFHTNYFVVAEDFLAAKAKAKLLPEFKQRKMHVDGMQLVEVVDGFRIETKRDDVLAGITQVTSHRYHELSKKPAEAPALSS